MFVLGNIRFEFEIIGFLCLFMLWIYWNNGRIKLNNNLMLSYFIIYCVLTIINMLVNGGNFSMITAYAIFRFTFTISILIDQMYSFDELCNFIDKILSFVIPVNLIFSIFQLFRILPVIFFYDMYYKTSLAPLALQLQRGYFDRAYGATGSPIILGGIASLAFAFYLNMDFFKKEIKNSKLKMMFCASCGILALSKTAIISIPCIFIVTLILCGLFFGSKVITKSFKLLFSVAIICFALNYVITFLSEEGFAITYYMSFLQNPFKALDSRYSVNGNLDTAIELIKSNFIFGVGNSHPEVFVGDSAYVVLLYETGIIGFISYFSSYIKSLNSAIKHKNVAQVSMISAILLIAFGNALQVSSFIILFVTVIIYCRKYEERKSI